MKPAMENVIGFITGVSISIVGGVTLWESIEVREAERDISRQHLIEESQALLRQQELLRSLMVTHVSMYLASGSVVSRWPNVTELRRDGDGWMFRADDGSVVRVSGQIVIETHVKEDE